MSFLEKTGNAVRGIGERFRLGGPAADGNTAQDARAEISSTSDRIETEPHIPGAYPVDPPIVEETHRTMPGAFPGSDPTAFDPLQNEHKPSIDDFLPEATAAENLRMPGAYPPSLDGDLSETSSIAGSDLSGENGGAGGPRSEGSDGPIVPDKKENQQKAGGMWNPANWSPGAQIAGGVTALGVTGLTGAGIQHAVDKHENTDPQYPNYGG